MLIFILINYVFIILYRSLLQLLSRLLDEYIGTQDNSFGHRSHESGRSSGCALLLLLLAFLVLLVLVRCRLPVIVCEVDLVRKLDAERASLDPGCLRLERDGFCAKLCEHTCVIHARDHVRRFNEGEREARFKKDVLLRAVAGEIHLDPGHTVAQAL